MAEVVLHNVTKVYPNGFNAVKGISLTIKEGEFIVFVGPSGCAKSTMLRMIAGLEEITSGDILIGKTRVNDIPPKDRGIAMVFQNYALYPHMSAYENMAFGLKQQKLRRQEIDRRISEAAQTLDIAHLLGLKPSEMSGGQRQRVALGRAMVRKPEVFLFDEPLSNLDAKLRVSTRVGIAQLHNGLKAEGRTATMIYVTHDQVEAMTLGDRICVLDRGQIVQVDTPMNLYQHPANRFVAGFIGSPAMNLAKATVEQQQAATYMVFDNGCRLRLPEDQAAKVRDKIGLQVWFGLRPEHITVLTSPRADAVVENIIAQTIELVESMGNELYLYFNIGNDKWVTRMPFEPDQTIARAEKRPLYFDLTHCHLFDIESERSLAID